MENDLRTDEYPGFVCEFSVEFVENAFKAFSLLPVCGKFGEWVSVWKNSNSNTLLTGESGDLRKSSVKTMTYPEISPSGCHMCSCPGEAKYSECGVTSNC